MIARLLTVLLAIATLLSPLSSRAAEAQDRAYYPTFKKLFPDAKRESRFYLLKLDDCRVTLCLYGSDILMIFVQGNKRDKVLSTVEHINQVFPVQGAEVIPFQKNSNSVVITYPYRESLGEHAPLRLLYVDGMQPTKENCQFLDFNNGELTFRREEKYTSLAGKKNKVTFEITLDLRSTHVDCVEFHLVKGRIEDVDVRSLICGRLNMSTSSSSSYYSTTSRAMLSKSFSGAEVLLYNSISTSGSSSFCIVFKRKTYYVGSISDVREGVRKRPKPAKLEYPTENSEWPAEQDLTPDTTADTETDTTGEEPPTPAEKPQQPAEQQNTTPQPQPQPQPQKRIFTAEEALREYVNLLRTL